MEHFNKIRSRGSAISRLQNHVQYWGHTSPGRAPEPLIDHVNLVVDYALKLIDVNGLESIIEKHIELIGISFGMGMEAQMILKTMFLDVLEHHDYGKINPAYQQKLGNPLFAVCEESPFFNWHSGQGALIFISNQIDEINHTTSLSDEEQVVLVGLAFLFSCCIFWHHSSGFFNPVEKIGKETIFGCWEDLQIYAKTYDYNWEEELILEIWNRREELIENSLRLLNLSHPFPLYTILKLNFSLLTAADYLATAHYMQDWRDILPDFGVLTQDDKKSIVNAFRSTKSFNNDLYEREDLYLAVDPELPDYQVISSDNLNLLRQSMAIQVKKQLAQNPDHRLFYLEAPTGGGKTNISMLMLAEMLTRDIETGNSQISKVFYVFPFTTLVTQTYQSLKETLGLRDDQIAELHSRAPMPEREGVDGEYGADKLDYIHYLFAHYPICVMTHIKFFDILKTNKKESNYLHHRLANSLVIIDELQSYPPKEWSRVIDFIDQYSRLFNIRFLLMSATLPKVHLLNHVDTEIVPLLQKSRYYFTNPNFCNRTTFNFELLRKYRVIDLDTLSTFVHKHSMLLTNVDEGIKKPRGSVFAIIEFIFKRRASEFYEKLVEKGLHLDFDHIFVLSGTILEPRRREIIGFLKNTDNRHKKILLITTQVVEAGVDIDMDIGFKDTSLIDSDEQLAGRINRNVNKKSGQLFLFNLDRERIIYKDDLRHDVIKNVLSINDHEEILKNKNFDKLYTAVVNKINVLNNRQLQTNIEDYRTKMRMLDFHSVHNNFKLIDTSNAAVFVPLNLVVKRGYLGDDIFSRQEMNWLQDNRALLEEGTKVSGNIVWNLYVKQIEGAQGEFVEKRITMKRLQSIMSRFTFNLITDSKTYKQIQTWGEEKYGYLYLSHYAGTSATGGTPIYDYEIGILDHYLEEGNII